jgi:uncharacterized membrane-anchored protein
VSTPDGLTRGDQSTARDVVNKVPYVTAYFWIIKILTTGMGEAASDSAVRYGGPVAVAVAFVAFAGSLVLQFRTRRYIAWVYWLAIAMVSVFGTMAADIPHRLGISLWATSGAYLVAVVVIFGIWRRLEGTLSFTAIDNRRREIFYWAAVLATFALGTAVGDLTARTWGLGFLVAGVMFAILITLPGIASRWLGLNSVLAFWVAYVLTRPLGASFADWMGSPVKRGGLGMGSVLVTICWTVAIVGFVVYLGFSRKDRSPGRQGDDAGPVPG